MTKLIKLLILTIILPLTGTSQLMTVNQINSGSFHDLVSLMSASVSDLFQDHNTNQYSEFVFTSDGFFSSQFVTQNIDSYTSFGFDLFFKEVPNFDGFTSSLIFNIGFFGNESHDRNKLILNQLLNDTVVSQTLFDYRNTPGNSVTPAPYSYSLIPSGTSYFSFSHLNPIKGLNSQSDSARFKIFQQYDPFSNMFESSFIFAIDDRENSLVDHDDGFFFLSGASITPVPEPRMIATLAVFGLVIVLLIKSRKNNAKNS